MALPIPLPPLPPDSAAPPSLPLLLLPSPPSLFVNSVSTSLEALPSLVLVSSDLVSPSASAVGKKVGLIETPANASSTPMGMGSTPPTAQDPTSPDPMDPQGKIFNWVKNLTLLLIFMSLRSLFLRLQRADLEFGFPLVFLNGVPSFIASILSVFATVKPLHMVIFGES